MKAESEVKICGYDVRMRYCAAAETGYESLSGKPIDTFMPGTDGKAKATTGDYIHLAVGAIIAAYAKDGTEPPITAETILYEAMPQEIITMVTEVVKLRAKWYGVPAVVKEDDEEREEGETEKNA